MDEIRGYLEKAVKEDGSFEETMPRAIPQEGTPDFSLETPENTPSSKSFEGSYLQSNKVGKKHGITIDEGEIMRRLEETSAENPLNSLQKAFDEKLDERKEKSLENLRTLPEKQRDRIVALTVLQEKQLTVEKQFQYELEQLERKFDKLYTPLYEKREQLVSGSMVPDEVEGFAEAKVEIEAELNQISPVESTSEESVKGVPEFWLQAMLHEQQIASTIQEKDKEVLKFLTNVSCIEHIENEGVPQLTSDGTVSKASKGFRLAFSFDPNPFFKNKELRKTYYLINDLDMRQVVMDRAEGTVIKWFEDMDVTMKRVKKKIRRKGDDDSSVQTISQDIPTPSFFNFFTPPVLPYDGTFVDEEEEVELELLVEEDYALGQVFRERLIPQAVLWYSNTAISGDFFEE